MQHLLQRADAIAQHRRLLETQRRGGVFHLPRELLDHLAVTPFQESLRQAHVLGVFGGRHPPDARRLATADLMQQAGPRTVREHRLLASAQAKSLLQ
jgi:hypothetical protein